ncbi:MAG: aspartate aminotransferase family protein [Roseitalea sp.]|jgi:adenosylmethionine-8-amino-7-oxononanoate aminotransferase|nr:aspartate aminotransferase family protein [Roseitalea sp.]MBO6722959.1 aspartate aminotransferase family protein [Roseitalea sp.]MBO6743575.1 aspartate aminotransferase family protein [Roseitalea sp.]
MEDNVARAEQAPSLQPADTATGTYRLWHPFTPMKQFLDFQPLVFEGGEGPYIVTTGGKRYLNLTSCLWNAPFGLGRTEIIESIHEQMQQLGAASLFRASHPRAIELARRLGEQAPGSLNHAFLTSNGSESIESAIKLVRQFFSRRGSKKSKVISLDKAYHGVSYGALAASGFAEDQHGFGPMPEGFLHIPRPDAREAPPGVTAADHNLACARKLEEAILAEGPDTVAMFLIEPVQGLGGVIVPTQDYFDRIVETCRKYDVKLVLDEVTTGFGRTGTYFAAERFGLTPDVMCLGKALGGGYFPAGAVLASDEIWETFWGDSLDDQFSHGSTYSGHPAACAAAIAVMDLLADGTMIQQVEQRGAHFRRRLDELLALPIVGAVRGIGMMFAIDLVADKKANTPLDTDALVTVFRGLFAKGLWVHPAHSKILLLPPFIMDEPVIDEACDGLAEVLTRAHRWI